MIKNYCLKDRLKKICYLIFFVLVLIFQTNYQILEAVPMDNYQSQFITEELRLKVPLEIKDVWLKAEREIWDPWLNTQNGFLGREIFWDKKREEALILVNWKNKKLWKSIPLEEVQIIQEKFENDVKTSLKVSENPFKLIYEGELDKQG